MAPTVSVIIPCYNQGRFLAEAVASVQAQTYPHWECLIINDGSTDETAKVGAALADADSKVRVINQANRGLAGARNRGLAEAKGQFIQFLDADDVIKPTKLEQQVRAARGSGDLAVVYSDYSLAAQESVELELPASGLRRRFRTENPVRELALDWETRLSVPCNCFLFDARFFTEYDIRFDEALPNHEDWDCWVRILSLKPSLYYVDSQLAVYRQHRESMSADRRSLRKGFLKAIAKQRAQFAADKEMLAVLRQKRREIENVYKEYSPLRRGMRFGRGIVGRTARAVLPAAYVNHLVRLRSGKSKGVT
jgi:glycosyltransferase involved in cell wall biosynthesis